MRKRNRLWKPELEPDAKKPTKPPARPPNDPVCLSCLNRPTCQYTCAPMKWVNGNVALKEMLLDEPIDPSSDYNKILADGIEAHRTDFTQHIAGETNLRRKVVAILLDAEIRIEEIAATLKISRRTVYRLSQLEPPNF